MRTATNVIELRLEAVSRSVQCNIQYLSRVGHALGIEPTTSDNGAPFLPPFALVENVTYLPFSNSTVYPNFPLSSTAPVSTAPKVVSTKATDANGSTTTTTNKPIQARSTSGSDLALTSVILIVVMVLLVVSFGAAVGYYLTKRRQTGSIKSMLANLEAAIPPHCLAAVSRDGTQRRKVVVIEERAGRGTDISRRQTEETRGG